MSDQTNGIHTGHDPDEGVSPNGMIVTGARRSRVPAEFEPVIAEAVARVKAIPGNQSLYVYGSVATGMARVGSSDVDLVTVGLDRDAALRIGRDLGAAFPSLCRGVEVGPAQLSDYEGPGDEQYGNRVFLRHYCVHLAGPDVAHGLPAFAADAAAAGGFNGDIGLCLDRWRTELLREPYPAPLGRRLARKTLLAVSSLVSIHDATWTTDRIGAARRWAIVKPELERDLQQVMGWATSGSKEPSRSEVQVVLEGLVAQVVTDFRKRIGLWR